MGSCNLFKNPFIFVKDRQTIEKAGGVIMKSFVLAGIVLSLLLLPASGISASAEPDLAKVLAGADWSKMETITVTMTEYAFSPTPVVLKGGFQPSLS